MQQCDCRDGYYYGTLQLFTCHVHSSELLHDDSGRGCRDDTIHVAAVDGTVVNVGCRENHKVAV